MLMDYIAHMISGFYILLVFFYLILLELFIEFF